MPMPGPRLYYYPNEKQYRPFLKEKGAWPWYAKVLPSFRPGAFTRTNGDGQPNEQDRIWFGPREWGLLQSAVNKNLQNLGRGERMAVTLAHHEWLHNLVPNAKKVAEGKVNMSQEDLAWLQEHCSHPGSPLAAFNHARRTGFQTNAFTRVLRRKTTIHRQEDFEKWLPEAVRGASEA